MQTYQIQINEEQRAAIEAALAAVPQDVMSQQTEEVQALQSMFQRLPADEIMMQTKYGHKPGSSLHGFCL